jgi:excisionase family DNA binding protein
MKEHPLVLTIDEVAIAMGISRQSAYEAAHAGDIPTIRIGKLFRVPRAALQSLIDGASKDVLTKQEQMPQQEIKTRSRREIEAALRSRREVTHVLYNRVPARLFEQLADAAEKKNCTIAAEVRRRLEESFANEPKEFEPW